MGGYADYKVAQFSLDVFVRGMMKEGQDFIFRCYSDFSEALQMLLRNVAELVSLAIYGVSKSQTH